MKEITVGVSHEIAEKVTQEMSAANIGSGLLDVFSTPSMITLMEKTSFLSIDPYLSEDETSVGGALNIRHLRATAIGKTVVCKSVVTEVVGKKVVFDVEVHEGEKHIGSGTHVRFIISKTAFMENL